MKKITIAAIFCAIHLCGNTQTNSLTERQRQEASLAIDSLKMVESNLQNIYSLLNQQGISSILLSDSLGKFIRNIGSNDENVLIRNLQVLHADNRDWSQDIAQRYHYILQSLALYKADLKNMPQGIKSEELNYLLQQMPTLNDRIKHAYTYNRFTDWRMQNKLDEWNGYLKEAYKKPPIQFTSEGITSSQQKSTTWESIKTMVLNTTEGRAIIQTYHGTDISFEYNKEQLDIITRLHVEFLAFFHLFTK